MPPEPGFIDAHVHVWPEVGDRATPSRYTAEDHFALAQPAGVTRTVLIQHSMFRLDNSYMLDAVRDHPGVFSAVAVIDADSPSLEADVKEIRTKGVRGFRITARKEKPWPEWDGMHRHWSAAATQGLAMCPLINPEVFPWVAALCEKHPDTTVVIDHLGRIGASGTINDADVRALCGLAKFPRVHVKISAFYALGRKVPPYSDLIPMIRQVFETYGPRRLMWASDAPYQVLPPNDYQSSVDLVRKRLDFVSAEDREWLLGKTAEGVLFSS